MPGKPWHSPGWTHVTRIRHQRQRQTRLSKIGHAFLRKALYMPAMVTLTKPIGVNAFVNASPLLASRRSSSLVP